jgi:hypothetical protein
MPKNLLSAFVLVLLSVIAYGKFHGHLFHHSEPTSVSAQNLELDDTQVVAAYKANQSHVEVQGGGVVKKVLPDDTQGSQHQKFIVQTASGVTLLIAYNLDLAPRIADLKAGQPIEFYGEYIFNPKGGIVHWTHHDPRGQHQDGWIKYEGKTYQ